MRLARPALVPFLLAWAVASGAAAQQRIVVEDFVGPQAGTLRAQVVRGLAGNDVAIVSRSTIAEAGSARGDDGLSVDRYRGVARELDISAFVSGSVQHGRVWRVTLWLRDGASGTVVQETILSARGLGGLGGAVRRSVWRRLGPAIRSSGSRSSEAARFAALDDEAPPTRERREVLDRAPSTSSDLDPELFPASARGETTTTDPEATRWSPLEAMLGARAINRGFRYRNDATEGMPPYDMPAGPEVTLAAEWYPGAHFSNGPLAHIGLTMQLERSLFMSSAGPNGVSYPTSDTFFAVGTRLRLPVGASWLGASVGYGRHGFSVEAAHPRDPAPDMASVEYEQVRLGADARIAVGSTTLLLSGSWLAVLDTGEIGEAHYWPGATAQGFEAVAGFAYPIGAGFELRGAVDLRMYMLELHPDAVARQVGSATDRYIGATFGATWRMDPGG